MVEAVTTSSISEHLRPHIDMQKGCTPLVDTKRRRPDIDAAKGLAIILVVFGHVVAREIPPGGEWYGVAKVYIYTFHMPLFIFLNGLVFALSWEPDSSLGKQLSHAWRRASRLAPPFLVMGLIIFCGKYITGLYTTVDNPVNGFTSIIDLLIQPTASFSSFLWYLYVLSIIYIAFPFIYRLCGKNLIVLLLFGIFIYTLPASNLFAWVRIQELLIFFVLGIIAKEKLHNFDWLTSNTWYFWGIFLFATWLSGVDDKLICGILAIPFALGLVKILIGTDLGFLEWVGRYTLPIYLFNTIFIGLAKAILTHFAKWNGVTFFFFFCFIYIIGVFAPIIFKRYALSKIRIIDKYTG